MKERKFLVLSRHEDELHISVLTGFEIGEELQQDGELYGLNFVPAESIDDTEDFPNNTAVIFEGDNAVPRAVSTVTKWEI